MSKSRFCAALILLVGLQLCPLLARAQATQTIYTDTLQNGWSDWSWASDNRSCTTTVHSGSDSISVDCPSYTALYLHQTPFDSSAYGSLSFWANGGAGGQVLTIESTLDGTNQSATTAQITLTGTWQQYVIPLSSLGAADQPDLDGFWFFNSTDATIPTFYVDDIALTPSSGPPPSNPTNIISVDASANRHAISSQIYGVAFATAAQLSDLNFPMNRSGGNEETTYNWQLNAHGKGNDYYFESIVDQPATAGADADQFVSASKAGGAQPMITVAMIGWTPKLGRSNGTLASYSIKKYGPQTDHDQYFPDAGNGVSVTNNTPITWNDPNDANEPVTVAFEEGYVQHLIANWGTSTNGGVKYYLTDNEHSLWYSTHQDIHPVGPTAQEILGKMLAYSAMVKSNDPSALVLGPEEWGWPGYFESGYDQQWSNARGDYNPADFPDRTTNGGMDYLPWLLTQIYRHDTNTHQRSLDYFTVHGYPQGGEFGDDVSSATQLLRNRSTRQYWDTNYVDESWVNSVIDLIPRLKSWAGAYYPGTKTGITEYNWGAESSINGATAQADLLGIFGREGLDLATRWTTPDASTPTYLSMKLYRNYDGHDSTFGETSVLAGGPNPDNMSVFAAQRTNDGALTIMVISKYLTGSAPVTINLTNYIGAGVAQIWQLNSSNVIARLDDLTYQAGVVQTTVPSQSVSLLIIPPSAPLNLQPGPARDDGQFEFWVNGETGGNFVLQSSIDLKNWTASSTNTLSGGSLHFLLSAAPSQQFYRAVMTGF